VAFLWCGFIFYFENIGGNVQTRLWQISPPDAVRRRQPDGIPGMRHHQTVFTYEVKR